MHIGLTCQALPPRVLLSGEPIFGVDYPTHWEQTRVMNEAIRLHGRTWAYDPFLLAGHPAGLFFDVDNQAHALFTWALGRVGLGQATAFNLFVLLVHLMVPLALLVAARLFGSGPAASIASLVLAVLVWHFDSTARWFWWAGMISFCAASALSVLVLALFARCVDGERPSLRLLVPLLMLLPLALLTHVWTFAILAVPMTVLYLRAARRLSRGQHLGIWLLAMTAILANLHWLAPALAHLDQMTRSGRGSQGTPLHLLWDFLDQHVDVLVSGEIAVHGFLRFLVLIAAGLALWSRRREGRDVLALGLPLAWTLLGAYGFSLIPLVRETEPYRFVLPALFVAVVAAGPLFAPMASRSWWASLPRAVRPLIGLLVVLLLPRGITQILYFYPELRPEARGIELPRTMQVGPPVSTLPPLSVQSRFLPFRHLTAPDEYRELTAAITRHCPRPGRVLVENFMLAEHLRGHMSLEIIGGFPDRRILQEQANIFRYLDDPRHLGVELDAYLRRYAIACVVATVPQPAVEARRDLLELLAVVRLSRIYRVRQGVSFFEAGSGSVRIGLNRIEVRGARPAPGTQMLRLRYHYFPTLRCRPGCRLAPGPVPFSEAPFITVLGDPVLPEHLFVENGY